MACPPGHSLCVAAQRNPAAEDFLQPSPCAHADDFAVAASSFPTLMTALFPAFEVVDWVAGLNLNHWKCCWVQYGNELLDCVSTNCEEFREMKIVKYAKYIGSMIGPWRNSFKFGIHIRTCCWSLLCFPY